MSSILVFGLLIASVIVTSTDAGSWSVAVQAVKRVQRNNTLKLSDVYGQALTYNSLLYKGTIYVGTPPAPFTVLFDTGSDILWLPRKGCTSSGPHVKYCSSGLELYDPDNSYTAKLTKKVLNISYGTGSACGYYFDDYLTFGSSMRFKKRIRIGAADVMTFSDQGILGLPSLIDPEEDGSSVMHEAWRQKLLDAPIFTVYMRKCPDYEADCVPGGVISFGALDKHNCDEVDNYIKVDAESQNWQFTVSAFQIGRGRISTSFKAISDSGSNRIFAPSRFVNQIMNELGATAADGGHVIECDFDATVTLTINGHQYTIPSHNMLSNLHNGLCQILLMSDEDEVWTLGTPFTEAFCQVHNIKKRTLGFAKSRN